MKKITYTIDSSIFNHAPTYSRVIILVQNIKNKISDEAIKKMLADSESDLTHRITPDNLLSQPSIVRWREVFQVLGMNPKEYRPAHEALARRVVSGKALPSINTAVDIGNIYSIRNLLPIGVHPLDTIKKSIQLRPALGSETFIPFGGSDNELPRVGEIILAEDDEVLTRSWIWRQSQTSITLPQHTSLVINVDGFTDVQGQSAEDLIAIAQKILSDLEAHCQAQGEIFVLNKNNTEIVFEV